MAERQKWEDLIEIRKEEEAAEKRKMMEERESDKVKLLMSLLLLYLLLMLFVHAIIFYHWVIITVHEGERGSVKYFSRFMTNISNKHKESAIIIEVMQL